MSKMSNVKSTHINWGPYVMKTKVPNYILNRLKKDGKKAKQSYNHALAGHIDNQFLYPKVTQKWFYNEIQPIVQSYRVGHCKFHGIEEINVDLWADDLWVNFMEAGDFNPLHVHGGDYSFVIFIDVPKEIKKEAKNFKGTSGAPGCLMFEYTQQAKPRWATTGTHILPETGDMYMFPALLQHWVAPFKSKVTRISVSGNIRILNKERLPRDYF